MPESVIKRAKNFFKRRLIQAKIASWERKHLKDKSILNDYPTANTNYSNRYKLYDYLLNKHGLKEKQDLVYLEFGVASGDSFLYWVAQNKGHESTFYGFDTFEGLPEKWEEKAKGTFSTLGTLPPVPQDDQQRCRFLVGLFEDTLGDFIVQNKQKLIEKQLVVHMDADLYSSTYYVLTSLEAYLKPKDVLIFDEFTSWQHEFKALEDFCKKTRLNYEIIGR